MLYADIPYVKQPVSRIFFGIASPLFTEGGDGSALIESMLDLGINAFDMARQYGQAEWSFGNWLEKSGRRDEVVILSKCAHHLPDGTKRVTPKDIREDLALTLKDLRTDHVDIYLLHRDDPDVPVGPIVETLNEMHAAGKIGAFGGSNWTHQRIQEANDYALAHHMVPFTVSSPNFGLAEQVRDLWGGGAVSISGPSQKEARAWYEANQMPVVSYSSLARGFFSGKLKSSDADRADQILDEFAVKGYVDPANFERLKRCEELAAKKGKSISQIALAYTFHQKVNTFAIIAASSRARMESNIEALSVELTEEECKYLNLGE